MDQQGMARPSVPTIGIAAPTPQMPQTAYGHWAQRLNELHQQVMAMIGDYNEVRQRANEGLNYEHFHPADFSNCTGEIMAPDEAVKVVNRYWIQENGGGAQEQPDFVALRSEMRKEHLDKALADTEARVESDLDKAMFNRYGATGR